MLVLISIFVLLSGLCLASPPTTSATFSSTSLLIINKILDSPPGLVNAARHGKLNDYLPGVCQDQCSNYTTWETFCLKDRSHNECGLEFCKRPMALGYNNCINCLLYVSDPSAFTSKNYYYIQTQFNIIQISCTAVGLLTDSSIELASYPQIGTNVNNATDFKPPILKAAAAVMSSAERERTSSLASRLSFAGIGIGVLGWNLL